MAREFAKTFYNSPAWKRCRKLYRQSVNGLCERCLAQGHTVPGDIVHHKVELSPANINDTKITLGWSNLELVCIDCHNKEHMTKHGNTADGLMFDEDGNLVQT